jgi:uncharacterized protein DUF2510
MTEPMVAPYAAPRPKRRFPSLRLALIVLFASLAVGVPSTVFFARPFVHTFTAPSRFAPSNVTLHLDHATYQVYAEYNGGVFGYTTTPLITVQDDTGSPLAVTGVGPTETITRGGVSYRGIARFDVPTAGDYTVRIRSDRSFRYVLARSFESTFHQAAPWLAPMVLGGMGVVTGVVFLIIALVRRPSPAPAGGGWYAPQAGQPAAPPVTGSLPVAGWYPDPQQPSRWRYWDGTAWTDHTG